MGEGEPGKFHGKYTGTVFDVDDPAKLGRVKLLVQEVGFTDVSKTTDWAYPSIQMMGNGLGLFTVPPKGSRVWVEFMHGDPNFPLYQAGHYSKPSESEAPKSSREADSKFSDSKFGDDAAPVYPQNNVLETPGGHLIEIDDSEGAERIRIFHKSGSQIQMRTDGDVKQRVKKSWLVEVDQDIILRGLFGALLDGGDFGGSTKGGIHTQATHPVCIMTGIPIGSSVSCQGSS